MRFRNIARHFKEFQKTAKNFKEYITIIQEMLRDLKYFEKFHFEVIELKFFNYI